MTLTQATKTCLRKYVTFSGRATRSEYWWFIVFLILGSVLAGIVDSSVFGTKTITNVPGQFTVDNSGPIASVFGFATALPLLAAGWRRMHDSGRSGIFLLYPVIVMAGIGTFAGFVGGFEHVLSGDMFEALAGASATIIGLAGLVFIISPLIVIWWLTRPTQPGTNAYGPYPNEVPT